MHTDDLSSDDEDEDGTGNRIGRVPLHWYEDYDHIGYDVKGGKLGRKAKGDAIDQFLERRDNPNFHRTVYDALNDESIVLSDKELSIINRLRHNK